MTTEDDSKAQPKVNYQALILSTTVLAVLLFFAIIGGITIMVRARRVRKRQGALGGTDEEAGCIPFFCRHRKKTSNVPKTSPKQSFARRHAEKILGVFRKKRMDVEGEKKKPQNIEAQTPTTTGARQNTSSSAAGNTTQTSVTVPAPAATTAQPPRISSAPLSQQSDRLEVREIAEGSLRKLDHLTG